MDRDYLLILSPRDLIVAPIYFILIICIGLLLRNKYTKGQPHIKKYFMPALLLRLIGALASALMYHFYYKGGDTAGYFLYAKSIMFALFDDPSFAWEVWSTHPREYPDYINLFFSEQKVYYIAQGVEMVTIGKIGFILSLITLKSYLGISFILSLFSFLGCWKLFEVFNKEFPHLYNYMAYATLFIPSLFFWGSAGLMKDTIIIIGMGYGVWGVYHFFIRNEYMLRSFLYMVIGLYFVILIKIYIGITLLPALALWIFLKKFSNIKNRYVKLVSLPVILAVGLISVGSLLYVMTNVSGSKYNADKILNTVKQTQWWHLTVSENSNGASYDLGEWEPTVGGLIPMIPKAINVTLFRPYFWEAKKVILVPTVIESFITLLLTLFIFLRVGIFKVLKESLSNSTLIFCLAFSLLFAFAVGFSSYNFGALTRYKIPCLPFYFVALGILYSKRKRRRKVRKLVIPSS